MPRQVTPLTNIQIKNAAIRDKEYQLTDLNGLRLRIRPNGAKTWIFQYTHPHTKKRCNMGLGNYPNVSLLNARASAQELKELVLQNIDPLAHREQQQLQYQAEHEHTLLHVAEKWFELKQHDVTPDYAEDIWRSFKLHIFDSLGKIPVTQITAPVVIKCLRPIEAKGSLETVKRLIQRLNEVMNYAVNYGLVNANPLVGIKEVFKRPKKENMATIPPDELPKLMRVLSSASVKRVTRALIEWQLHTMTRPSEAAKTRWDEINFEENVWTIPAERMKKRRDFRIPLTKQMLLILESIGPISAHREYVFPADRDPKKHTNSQTANAALKRMGFQDKLVSHGMRSIASTALNEQGFDRDLVEAALSHVDTNQVRSAYNRTDYLERRREMMQWWSDFIEKAGEGNLSVAAQVYARSEKK